MLIAALLPLLLSGEPALPAIPKPPDGVFEPELTKVANERAAHEMKEVLGQLERDTTRSASEKAELRKRIAALKIAVYTTPRTLDETVGFYERTTQDASFIFAQRSLLNDLHELARTSGLAFDSSLEKTWAGATGRSARWSRQDGSTEIDIDDHLIDPRDGTITKKTVVLVTTLGK